MLTCALPDFDSEDLVSFQNPAKFWTLFTICVIAALLLLCSLVLQLQTLVVFHFWKFQKQQQEDIAVSPQYWARAAASKVVEQQASSKISNFPF